MTWVKLPRIIEEKGDNLMKKEIDLPYIYRNEIVSKGLKSIQPGALQYCARIDCPECRFRSFSALERIQNKKAYSDQRDRNKVRGDLREPRRA